MDKRILRFLPPGTDLKQTEIFVGGMLSATASWNLTMFVIRYYFALDGLYVNQIWRRVLIPDAKIADFSVLLRGALVAYVICLFLCVLSAVNYYWSFHRESVSAYVMRRIPDAKELHIRCVTVPVCAALLITALIILLLFVERTVYVTFTPAGCLGDTSIDLFRILSMKG